MIDHGGFSQLRFKCWWPKKDATTSNNNMARYRRGFTRDMLSCHILLSLILLGAPPPSSRLKPVMKLVELDSFFHIFDWVGALVFQPPFPTGFAMALPLGRRLLPRLLPRHDPLRCRSYRSLSHCGTDGIHTHGEEGRTPECWREHLTVTRQWGVWYYLESIRGIAWDVSTCCLMGIGWFWCGASATAGRAGCRIEPMSFHGFYDMMVLPFWDWQKVF